MLSIFIVTATVLMGMTHGDSMHHFRHHGLTEMLRERLGLGQESSMDGNPQQAMMLPELIKVLSSLHERHSERLARRLSSFSQDNSNNEQKESKAAVPEGVPGNDAYQRLMTLAINHLMNNLQTVEGGTEAMNWISALRAGAPTPTPTRLHQNQDAKQVVATSTVRSVLLDDSENETIPK